MTKLKRGVKHPTKNLVFYQYHHPYFKETNGECWLTPKEFERRREKHRLSTKEYKRKHPLMYIVSGTIQRDIKKYQTSNKEILDLKFIRKLLIKQENKCYWYNIDLMGNLILNTYGFFLLKKLKIF
jgi:hypothetical protein